MDGAFAGFLAAHEVLRIVRARRNLVSFDLRAPREFLLDLAARLALRRVPLDVIADAKGTRHADLQLRVRRRGHLN